MIIIDLVGINMPMLRGKLGDFFTATSFARMRVLTLKHYPQK